MEKKIYTDNFERFLKEKTDEFKMYPSKRVWYSIYNNLHPARKWPSAAVCLLLFSALIFIGYINSGESRYDQEDQLVINQPGTQSSGSSKLIAVNDIPDQFGNTSSQKGLTGTLRQPSLTTNSRQESGSIAGRNSNRNQSPNNRNQVRTPQPEPTRIVVVNADDPNQTMAEAPQIVKDLNVENTIAPDKQQALVETVSSIKKDEVVQPVADAKKETVTPKVADNLQLESVNIQATDTEVKPDQKLEPAQTESKKTASAISNEDRKWMDNYAYENRSRKNKWRSQTGWEVFVTPGLGYRKLTSNSNEVLSSSLLSTNTANLNINKALNHKPSIALEAGVAMIHQFARNLRWKAGLQLNYSSYTINAYELGHPVLTTLQMKDASSGHSYLKPALTKVSSSISGRPVQLTNSNLQISIPLGLETRLAGKDNIQWFAGFNVQGSLLLNSQSNLLSSDKVYYVKDENMVRKWNLNTAVETFVTYKTESGLTFRAGPQFRYQPLSTYTSLYNINERPYSLGLKLGIIKGF